MVRKNKIATFVMAAALSVAALGGGVAACAALKSWEAPSQETRDTVGEAPPPQKTGDTVTATIANVGTAVAPLFPPAPTIATALIGLWGVLTMRKKNDAEHAANELANG